MSDPYTLSIHVVDGDPEGVCVIQRRNWPGIGVRFPRHLLGDLRRQAPELVDRTGVYVLVGPDEDGSGLQKLYIGEGDVLARLETHDGAKDWWEWAIAFVSGGDRLTKSETLWLEQELIDKALAANAAVLENAVRRQTKAMLPRADATEMASFLRQILSIVPLFGISAFNPKAAITPPAARPSAPQVAAEPVVARKGPETDSSVANDTLIVFSNEEAEFERVWLGERAWYPVRVASARLAQIKYVAIYRSAPVSAIDRLCRVARFTPLSGNEGYRVELDGLDETFGPVGANGRKHQVLRGTKYTSRQALLGARAIADVLPVGAGR